MAKSSKKSASEVEVAPAVVVTKPSKEVDLMFKKRLHDYAQKAAIPLPVYCTINEGKPHTPLFRSTVKINGVKYRSPNVFSHRKSAEMDAARIAFAELEVVIAATKPLKKGKREAEEAAEEVPAKKPKQNEAALKQAVAKKEEAKVKAAGRSSDEDSDSKDDEPKAKAPEKKVPAPTVAKNGSVAAKKKADGSDDSDSEDDSDEKDEEAALIAAHRKEIEDTEKIVLEEEAALIAAHRKEIEDTEMIVLEEKKLLAEVEQQGSQIDSYVTQLSLVLSDKAASLVGLQSRLARFQHGLKEQRS